jgi:hypothetical protein
MAENMLFLSLPLNLNYAAHHPLLQVQRVLDDVDINQDSLIDYKEFMTSIMKGPLPSSAVISSDVP